MPYEWTEKNIAQTNVVHEEIHIPKTFPELLVTKYDVSVNGIKISDSSVTVDDYTSDSRVVHLVLYQKQISSMANSISDKSKMAFTITPSKDEKFPITAFTRNAIFEVGLSWEPAPIESGKKLVFMSILVDILHLGFKRVVVLTLLSNNTEKNYYERPSMVKLEYRKRPILQILSSLIKT